MSEPEISFTIPMRKEVLYKTAVHLISLAGLEVDIVEKGGAPVVPEPVAHKVDTVAEFNNDTPQALDERLEAATAPTAPPAPPCNGQVVDADGRPWDARIDSSSKALMKDGRWKLRRGVDKDLIEKVLAEYKTEAPAPVVEAVAPAPVVPPAPAVETVAPAPPPPPPVEIARDDLKSFADFKALVMGRINGAGLHPGDLASAIAMAGSTASGMMPSIEKETPEMIDAIYRELVAIWAQRDSKTA